MYLYISGCSTALVMHDHKTFVLVLSQVKKCVLYSMVAYSAFVIKVTMTSDVLMIEKSLKSVGWACRCD